MRAQMITWTDLFEGFGTFCQWCFKGIRALGQGPNLILGSIVIFCLLYWSYKIVKQNKEAIKSIPIKFRTVEMYQLLVNTDYHTMIPGKYINYTFDNKSSQCCNDELKNQYNDLNNKYEKLIASLKSFGWNINIS